MVQAEGIRKVLGERLVLRDVSLELRPGEAVAVVGPNGSGKTTLLRILATLLRPDGGKLCLFGLDPQADGPTVRARIGWTGHETCLYPGLTVEENLRLFAALYGVPPDRLETLLRGSGLWARRKELVRNLSRGWQQRASLVRALLPSPALLLLDEPFTALDEEGAEWLRGLVRAHLDSGGALVLTTHRPEEVGDLCHRVLRLVDGRLVALGTPALSPPARSTYPQSGRIPGFWAAYRALVKKDLRIELRAKELVLSMGLMALVAMVLFSVALGLDPTVVAAAAPGVLWTTVTFAALLGLGRAYALEHEQQAGWAVLASPADRAAILGAKATSTFLWMVVVEALTLPVFAVLLNVGLWPRLAALGTVLLFGSAGLALPGTLLSALSAKTRLRQLLLAPLLLPLALPLLIGSVAATAKVLQGLPLGAAWPELRVVGAFAIILGAASLLLFESVVEEDA